MFTVIVVVVVFLVKKRQKFAELVEFRVQKGLFLFVTHCYIWAFFGFKFVFLIYVL